MSRPALLWSKLVAPKAETQAADKLPTTAIIAAITAAVRNGSLLLLLLRDERFRAVAKLGAAIAL